MHWKSETARIARETLPGLDVFTLSREGVEEITFSLYPLSGETPTALMERLVAAARDRGAAILKQLVFGRVSAHAPALAALEEAGRDWPVTWVEGAPCAGGEVAGVQAYAVAGAEVESVFQDGRPVARFFEDAHARYCFLGDVRPPDPTAPRPQQARCVFESMEAALRQAGMECLQLVRTWLFLDRLLEWYHEFNPVRTRFFTERGIFDALVPASTGIGGSNPSGTALVAEALAVLPRDSSVWAAEVLSPLQCPARRYGSSFSRAAELITPGARRLFVSGTASIEVDGKTAHVGDLDAQVDLTMRVVEAILCQRGMGFHNVSRAVAYYKHGDDCQALDRYCK
ncbi:MAG: hypothetical protein QHJ73_17380, partial [Armatimonadota bacterium]|nr:hypothetical protein [Armatimonadota bacterium]